MFMNFIICVFVLRLISIVNGVDNVTIHSEVENSSESNQTRIFTVQSGNGGTIPAETIQADDINIDETPPSDSAGNFPSILNIKHKILGQQALNLLQNISPVNLVRPIQEKIQRFIDYVNHPNSPHIKIPLFNPLQLLSTLHQNGQTFLSGINGAVFGSGNLENYDYPFPYRKAGLNGENEGSKSGEHL